MSQEILAYAEANGGQRPTENTSLAWSNHKQWLGMRDVSLPQLCTKLGLPELRVEDRTTDTIRRDIHAYVAAHGERPMRRTNDEWMNVDCWLINRQTSLAQVCDAEGVVAHAKIPSRPSPRTLKGIEAEILAYGAANGGYRPLAADSPEWKSNNGWLVKHADSTLAKKCTEMGLLTRKLARQSTKKPRKTT